MVSEFHFGRELREIFQENRTFLKKAGEAVAGLALGAVAVVGYGTFNIRGHEFNVIPPLHTFLHQHELAFYALLVAGSGLVLAGVLGAAREAYPEPFSNLAQRLHRRT